ncbi:DNA-binding transcriptional LysR family regulator [Rhodococcus sp. 27YEA15]|uniref:LysR family transcriptional regulator n=1 Tax=Rhodococcus sp. 27YEA15 TaxID=3156259 RepID=UPI003C7CDBE0
MGSFDLNLVRTLVLLCETKSVTATASALHLTQPTVSYALGKLRRMFDDELFQRTPSGLIPTAQALRLYEPWQKALAEIEMSVAPVTAFDAAASDTRFTVALSDIGEITLLPPLLRALRDEAPGIRIAVRPLDVKNAERELARGELDAFVATPVIPSDMMTRIPLHSEPYVGLVRADHPRLRTTPIDHEQISAEEFVKVAGSAGHAAPTRAMEGLGLGRRTALEVSTFAALPHVVTDTDLVAIIPRRLAEVFAIGHDLRYFDLPWEIEKAEVAVYARHSHSRSAAQHWLVGFMVSALKRGGWSEASHGVSDDIE